MRKYGESKTTRIMMATVPHVTSGLGLRKFQADGFLLTRVYQLCAVWCRQYLFWTLDGYLPAHDCDTVVHIGPLNSCVALSLITVLQLPGNYSVFLLDVSLLCYATNTPQLWSLSLPLIFYLFPG